MRGSEMLDVMGYLPPEMVEAADKPARRQSWLRWAAIPACVCLILGSFAAARMFSPVTDIHINYLGDSFHDFSAYIDILAEMYTGLPEEEFREIEQEFASETGIRYAAFTARIPTEFELNYFYATLTPAKPDGSTEESVRDYVLEYTAADGGRMKLAVSAKGKPLRCVILPDAAYEPSRINGTEMWIYAAGDEFLAEVSHDALYYSIQTDGISEALLREVLDSITGN